MGTWLAGIGNKKGHPLALINPSFLTGYTFKYTNQVLFLELDTSSIPFLLETALEPAVDIFDNPGQIRLTTPFPQAMPP